MKFRFITICSLIMVFSSHIFAQMPPSSRSGGGSRNFAFPVRQKPTREQKRQLAPDYRDLAKYARFLEQPKTGIFRLLPDLDCNENPLVIKADEECLKYIPESSFYSFREKEHTVELLSDIRLDEGHLISDGIMAQGIMVPLGDVALENVSLKSEGLNFLTNYLPNSSSPEAKKQYTEILRGVRIGKHLYRKSFPARENTTFAMRVIAYRGNIFRSFRGYRYNLLDGDKRIDMILAFRIISKGNDGGITMLWKELERRRSPEITYPKRKN